MISNKTIAIIPAFNEEKTIEKVIEGIKPYVDEIIAVDDCSFDATAVKARSSGAFVISHKENKGYDASIQDGFDQALKRSAEIFITLDADGQHKPEDVKKIIDVIKNGQADLAIGQRLNITHPAEKLFAFYTDVFFGIKDPLCGLKAYKREVYETVGHFNTIESIGTQLTVEAIKKGFKLAIVPIVIEKRKDISRFYFKSLRGNYKILKALVRLILLKKKKV